MPALATLLPLLATGGSILARKFLSPEVDLEDARFQTGRARRNINAQATTLLAKSTADIRSVGASRRLPAGATQSAIAGATKRATQGAASAEARLEGLRNQADARIAFAQAQAKQQKFEDIFNLSLAGVGSLSKVALLKNAGLLGKSGNSNDIGGGVPQNRIGGANDTTGPGVNQIDLSNLDEETLQQLLNFENAGPLSGINVNQLKGLIAG